MSIPPGMPVGTISIATGKFEFDAVLQPRVGGEEVGPGTVHVVSAASPSPTPSS